MKIDLLIWTLNSEKTLPITLRSIEKAIPKENINQKIIVDGGSIDNTIQIAEKNGWTIIKSKKGIAKQANLGLKHIETSVFASFEHDIILDPNWFYKIKDTIKPENVAASQGIRLSINPTLRAIDKYAAEHGRVVSIDNNLYKTEIIRKLGGFKEQFYASADRDLQDRIRQNGYKWIINKNIISLHNKTGLKTTAKHMQKLSFFDSYEKEDSKKAIIKTFFFSPLRGLQIAIKEKQPQTFLVYPYLRFYVMKGKIIK